MAASDGAGVANQPVYNLKRKPHTRTGIAIAGLLMSAAPVLAQTGAQRQSVTNGGEVGRKVEILVMPSGSPKSLFQLVRHSSLIVDGTVSGVLPVLNTNQDPNTPPQLETHSIIGVNAVLSGTVPNNSAHILVAQIGGIMANWDISVAGDTLVSPGERYIFFLVSDERKELPNTSGMPRYAVAGVWSGKVKVTNGKVSFAASAGSQLTGAYNGLSVGSFLQTLDTTINHPYTDADTKLPINLAPTP